VTQFYFLDKFFIMGDYLSEEKNLMARPVSTNPLTKKSAFITVPVSPRLRYQTQLAADIKGKTVATFVQEAIQRAITETKMPHPTGIPLAMQETLWQTVVWKDGKKTFVNADIRNRLDDFRVQSEFDKPKAVSDEVILYDEGEAARFFLRGYLAESTMPRRMRPVWEEIKLKTKIAFANGRSWGWEQAKIEDYIDRHWLLIANAIAGKTPHSSLPDEQEIRDEQKLATKRRK
jgi:hypothetical protein